MSSTKGGSPAPSPARNRSEILADALALFEGGRNWIKNHLWEDDDDADWLTTEDFIEAAGMAQNFCAYGAIMKSMALHGEREQLRAIRREYSNCDEAYDEDNQPIQPTYRNLLAPGASIVSTNDNDATTFEDVKVMFCRGIKTALAQEAIEAGVEPEAPLINPAVAPDPSGDSPTDGPVGPSPSCRIDPATGLVVCD